jgi:hypothetical protein
MSPFVLHVLALLAVPQDTTRNAAAVQLLAMRGTDASLDAAVRGSPVVAHDALARLMTAASRSPAPAPALAAWNGSRNLARQTGDSFPVRQIARFSRWSPGERREKVALDSVRRWQRRDESTRLRGGAASVGGRAHGVPRLGDTAVSPRRPGISEQAGTEKARSTVQPPTRRAAGLARVAGDQRTACNALGGLANVQRDRVTLPLRVRSTSRPAGSASVSETCGA